MFHIHQPKNKTKQNKKKNKKILFPLQCKNFLYSVVLYPHYCRNTLYEIWNA